MLGAVMLVVTNFWGLPLMIVIPLLFNNEGE